MFVNTGDCKFLLDAGLSHKQIKLRLEEIGESIEELDYIFITHEHLDHINGLKVITKKYSIPIIASYGTMVNTYPDYPQHIVVKDKSILEFPELKVYTRLINHDATEPLCYAFQNSSGEKLLYLTDCGMAKYFKYRDYDVYIIEANYSKQILQDNFEYGRIHEFRYNRAYNGMGHLEINDTIEFLSNNIGTNTKQIILYHLSHDNADPELFKQMVSDELFFFDVHVADRGLDLTVGVDKTER